MEIKKIWELINGRRIVAMSAGRDELSLLLDDDTELNVELAEEGTYEDARSYLTVSAVSTTTKWQFRQEE